MPMAIIFPWDTSQGTLNCKRGAWLAGDAGVRVMPKILPAASAAACCCGGMPPLIQEVNGQGIALLNAGGTVVKRELSAGETLLVDSDAVVGFTDGIRYDVRQVGSPLACMCGGEGCFNTELSGPGTIYLQSLSYEKLIKTLVTTNGAGNKKKDESISIGGSPEHLEMAR